MANNESLGDLYARIGLNFDELERGFIDVERTLRQNLGSLNRENRIINLQTQIDLQGLDELNDAERILQTRQRGLQRQLDNQRQRLRLLSAQLEDTARQTGANSDATQRAQIEFEQARLSVAQLERQLEELNNQSQDLNLFGSQAGLVDKFNKLFTAAEHLADVYNLVNDAVNNLIGNYKELQKQGAAFNLPINQIDDFARKIRLAGGDLDDIQGYLAGLTDALIKGETDDPEFIALTKRYGETIFEASGKLKSYLEIWEAVHRAFKKAKAEGKEIEFLQMTGGESGIKDALQALDNWDKAAKLANQIVKAKIDFTDLDKATDTSSKLTEQMDELGKAIGAVFQPFTTSAAEGFFEILKKGTDILNDLNGEFKDLNKQAAELPSILFSPLDYNKKMLGIEKAQNKKLVSAMDDRDKTLKKLFDNSAGLDKAHADLKKRLKDKAKTPDPLQQYADQRTQDLKDAIADLRVEIDYENEYQQAVKTAQLERERALRQIVVGAEERAAIEGKYRTDIEKAEKDHNDKLEDMARETAAIMYEASHSAYQKEIFDIEQWKKKALEDLGEYKDAIGNKNQWLKESAEIAAQAATKEVQAFENEMDRIKDKNLSLAEKLFKKTHSQAEFDIYQAQKEAQGYLDEGIYNPHDVLTMLGLEVGDIKAKAAKDTNYSAVPELNFALPDVDYFGDLSAAVDDAVEGLTELSRAEKDALNLFNIPDPVKYKNPFGESPEPVKLAELIDLDNDFARAGDAVNKFADTVNDAKIKIDYGTDETQQDNAGQPYKSGNFKIPAQSARVDETPNFTDKLKLAAQKLKADKTSPPESPKLPQVKPPNIDNIANKIADLTRQVGAIAQDINQRQTKQQPQINISVNPNINLGGAYVFDNKLKDELTQDITAEVATAVTDAVSRATSNIRF